MLVPFVVFLLLLAVVVLVIVPLALRGAKRSGTKHPEKTTPEAHRAWTEKPRNTVRQGH